MSKNNTATFIIYGLAIVGLLVLTGPLLQTAGSLVGLIIMLVGWMFAGALAGRILRGAGYGPIGDIGLGLVGGIVGSLLFGLLGLGGIMGIPILGPILVGAVGAVVFVYIVRLFNSSFAR